MSPEFGIDRFGGFPFMWIACMLGIGMVLLIINRIDKAIL